MHPSTLVCHADLNQAPLITEQHHHYSEARWGQDYTVGMFSAAGTGKWLKDEGKRNAVPYVNILDDNLLKGTMDLRLEQMFILQQDSDAKHTVKITKE